MALRAVRPEDLPIFYEQQLDPAATQMADFPARDRASFDEHWARILADANGILRTIVADGEVAGNVVSWRHAEGREVGFWLGRAYWGRGIASEALRLFLAELDERPLIAFAVKHNVGSQRVLEKAGFRRVAEDAVGYHFRLDAAD